jgi:hypothetical protein
LTHTHTYIQVKTGEVKIKDNVVTESTTTTSSSSKESDLLPWYQTAMENARQSETIPLGDRMESAWRDALNGKVDMETAWKRTMDATSLLNNTPLIQEKERTYEFVEKNPYEKDVSAFLKGQAAFKKGEINDAIYLLGAYCCCSCFLFFSCFSAIRPLLTHPSSIVTLQNPRYNKTTATQKHGDFSVRVTQRTIAIHRQSSV